MLRVRPGVALVRASFAPTSELMTLDLPTLDRPKKAISGRLGAGKCATSVAAARNLARILMRQFAMRRTRLARGDRRTGDSPEAILVYRSANRFATKLLAQGESLVLVGRSYVGAINLVRPEQQRHIVQPTHKLPVFH